MRHAPRTVMKRTTTHTPHRAAKAKPVAKKYLASFGLKAPHGVLPVSAKHANARKLRRAARAKTVPRLPGRKTAL